MSDHDLPFAITLDPGSSRANHTGSWRSERPVYIDRLPPCNHACPAGENIQDWLFHAESGDYAAAWQALMRDNPMPAVMGRVCYHTCENACNRARLDEAVSIHSVERFLGDYAIAQGLTPHVEATPSGKRVLVVGAGPSGLSAAYHLARLGHAVTIREAGPMAGGMMRFGIPKYRLPREVLDAEIARILDLGVTLELNAKVADIEAAFAEGFDAIFTAVGAPSGPAHRNSRPCRRPHPRRGQPASGCRTGPSAAAWPAGDRLWRRQYRDGRRPHRPPSGRRRGDDRLPPQPRPDAGA